MKRKKKWWLWLTIAVGCMVIVFVIAELTGASVTSVFGWGVLGILSAVGIIAALIIGAVFIIFPITAVIWFILGHLISNKEILYVTLGSLGFCAILVGWVLTTRHSEWSLPVMMVGFVLGCFTGVEYQKHSLSTSNEWEIGSARISDEIEEG